MKNYNEVNCDSVYKMDGYVWWFNIWLSRLLV